jgi:hypothetical protein
MEQAFRKRMEQPDPTSCGPASIVVAQMMSDPAYAEFMMTGTNPDTGRAQPGTLAERFTGDTLAMHTKVTGLVDAKGRAQLPWPKSLGTPPWAIASQMSAVTGTTYCAKALNPFNRRGGISKIRRATDDGHAVPLYVGNTRLPRHVVLVLDSDLHVYEPAIGRRVQITEDDFAGSRLDLGGWKRPWIVVVPT